MAIKTKVQSDNGIVTEYHRVAMVKIDTNQQNTILVLSYLSEDARQIEKDYENGMYNGKEETLHFPYTDYEYINTEYMPNMTVEAAYAYLKTLSKFKNAEDV